ncbi:MAG: hypothetical protein GY711_11065 [bacterium]|nr:hypothetical protein [bacterium]
MLETNGRRASAGLILTTVTLATVLFCVGHAAPQQHVTSADTPGDLGLPCGQTTALAFLYSGCFTACGGALDICDVATAGLLRGMASASHVLCGLCEGASRCDREATALSGPVSTSPPMYDPINQCWTCTACFSGTHRVLCLPCP